MGSRLGVLKIAAKRLGLTFEEYQARLDAGLKWCIKCKQWRDRSEFSIDRSRGDGLNASCQSCCMSKNRKGPGKAERREKREQGLAWCKDCEAWLPLDRVRSGLCRQHTNERERKRYHEDPEYRFRRKAKQYRRKRGVEAVPPLGQEILLEEFDNRCAYCGGLAETWDHIVPVSKSGRTHPGNVVPACQSCNSSKKDRDVFEWLEEKGLSPHDSFFNRLILAEILPPY